jgi:hypothetical protein
VHLLYFATLIAVLLVLVGVLVRQLWRSGRLGLAGFLVAFVGTSMMLLDGREHLFSHEPGGLGDPALAGAPDRVSCSFVPASYYAMFAVSATVALFGVALGLLLRRTGRRAASP